MHYLLIVEYFFVFDDTFVGFVVKFCAIVVGSVLVESGVAGSGAVVVKCGIVECNVGVVECCKVVVVVTMTALLMAKSERVDSSICGVFVTSVVVWKLRLSLKVALSRT